jgi:hypothetical protein
MRAPYEFTLTLRTARDEPGIHVTKFRLQPRQAEQFAKALGIPWPTEEACFRKQQLEITVERHFHTDRPPKLAVRKGAQHAQKV